MTVRGHVTSEMSSNFFFLGLTGNRSCVSLQNDLTVSFSTLKEGLRSFVRIMRRNRLTRLLLAILMFVERGALSLLLHTQWPSSTRRHDDVGRDERRGGCQPGDNTCSPSPFRRKRRCGFK